MIVEVVIVAVVIVVAVILLSCRCQRQATTDRKTGTCFDSELRTVVVTNPHLALIAHPINTELRWQAMRMGATRCKDTRNHGVDKRALANRIVSLCIYAL